MQVSINFPAYHGRMDAGTALARLKTVDRPGAYLVRFNKDFIISYIAENGEIKHEIININMEVKEDDDEEDYEIDEKAIIRAATGGTGLGNYDPNPMSCGDCDFETHYENELFEHLKMHLRKEANIPDDTETEVMKPLTFLFTHNMSTFNV